MGGDGIAGFESEVEIGVGEDRQGGMADVMLCRLVSGFVVELGWAGVRVRG